MSVARGIADGMLANRASAAESDASYAKSRASTAEIQAYGANLRAAYAEQELEGWKAEVDRLRKLSGQRASTMSAGLIVINAFIAYMETMPPQEREKMRHFVAKAALQRMREIDSDVEYRKNNPHNPSIEQRFKELSRQNDYLKVA